MSACTVCGDKGEIKECTTFFSHKIQVLREEIRKRNHQRTRSIADILHVILEYWPLGQQMLKRFGWKSWYSFWYTKLFVSDEGGEFALKNILYRKWPFLLKRPFKFEMEHTTVCDKKCFFCEHTYWDEKSTRVTFDYFKKTIEPLKELKWLNITGEGSSFLNKDFMKMIEYARKERHINVNFVDEMDFFDEVISRKVVGLGVNSIWISFDGATKEMYEKIKVNCDYDKALENIRTLTRVKRETGSHFPVLHFRYIITKDNYHEMPAFLDLISSIEDRGVRSRVEFIGLLVFPGIEEHYFPLENVPEDVIVETLQKALKHKINLYFSHESTTLPSMSRCVAWAEPYVLIGGEVISCCAIVMSNNRAFLKENSFGNVNNAPFLDIWDSERFRKFRTQVVDDNASVPATCYGCRAYDTTERAKRCGVDMPIGPEVPSMEYEVFQQHKLKRL